MIVSLRVYPNPFAVLDHDGDPACALPRGDLRAMLIGASVDLERTKKSGVQKYKFDLREPVTLPDCTAHRNAIRDGELLVADEETAREVGATFVPIAEALAASKAKAIAHWRAATGRTIDPVLHGKPLPAAAESTPTPASAES